jgi:hypothetical protein
MKVRFEGKSNQNFNEGEEYEVIGGPINHHTVNEYFTVENNDGEIVETKLMYFKVPFSKSGEVHTILNVTDLHISQRDEIYTMVDFIGSMPYLSEKTIVENENGEQFSGFGYVSMRYTLEGNWQIGRVSHFATKTGFRGKTIRVVDEMREDD